MLNVFFNIFNHLMFMHSSVIKASRTCTGIKMSHSNIARCVSHCEVCMPEDTSWHYGPCLCSWSRGDLSRLAHRGPNKIFSPLSGHTRTQLAETATCRLHPADCDFVLYRNKTSHWWNLRLFSVHINKLNERLYTCCFIQ